MTVWTAEKYSPEYDFDASAELPENRQMCPQCRKRIYMRMMIEDNKHFQWYLRLFQRGNVSMALMKELAMEYHVRLRMLSPNLMQVVCLEDTWRIEASEQISGTNGVKGGRERWWQKVMGSICRKIPKIQS